jgi:hypothetical protein
MGIDLDIIPEGETPKNGKWIWYGNIYMKIKSIILIYLKNI